MSALHESVVIKVNQLHYMEQIEGQHEPTKGHSRRILYTALGELVVVPNA